MRYLRRRALRAMNWLLARLGLPRYANGGTIARPPAVITSPIVMDTRRLDPAFDRAVRAAAHHRVTQALGACRRGHPLDAIEHIRVIDSDTDLYLCTQCSTIFEEEPGG